MLNLYLAMLLVTIDGDTFKSRVEVWPNVDVVTSVRIMGIDTPEIKGKCVAEKNAALAAKNRLNEILTGAKKIEITKVELDKYAGRVDALVFVDGEDVGLRMIKEGFARPYNGATRSSWC